MVRQTSWLTSAQSHTTAAIAATSTTCLASVASSHGQTLTAHECTPLPIAGLMNAKPVEEMSEIVSRLEEAWAQIGCSMPSPFMTMALIPLACLPELRLTNRGLVDCTKFQFVPLIVEE